MSNADDGEFRGRVQKLEGLLGEIESFHDPAARATALEAVRTLMEFHGAAVGRMMEKLAAANGALVEKIADDDLVSSLLLLYGLHPADFETRVEQAIERARPVVRNSGATITSFSTADGAVRVVVERGGHSCGSTAGKIKAAIEEAIYDRAPEVTSIEIAGLEATPSTGFVSMEQVLGSASRAKKSVANAVSG